MIKCEDCKHCKVLTKIDGVESFVVCEKRQFSQNYPTIIECTEYMREDEPPAYLEFTP